jgi:hypothetical protein
MSSLDFMSTLKNKELTNMPIVKASQTIMFKLNEKSAVLKSTVDAAVAAIPKRLIFDRSFFIYLKKKSGKWPYSAMWVNNPELMLNQ